MKERMMNLALVAVLLLGLGAGVVSCKDDDNDDNLTPEQKAEQQAAKANAFWEVVGQLVSADEYTDDYADKTFTPTIGEQDPTDATTRIVYTNDVATAAQRFNYLTGAAVDTTTTTYTWRNDDVGTLTYTLTNDGASLARVDVSIGQVPALKHIVYKTAAQGENASFNGKAYYRFGDVVSRDYTSTDGTTVTEYWICVRPAFGPEGKKDSHWACVNVLPSDNIFHRETSDKAHYYLPTKLGTNKEQMQNFAEMLYAICRSDKWEENISYYSKDGFFGASGLPLFHDFKKANLRYHNQFFWQNVAQGWEGKDIARKALNISSLGQLAESIDRDGVTLLYNGYSWWTLSSWNCQLWQATYTNGTDNKEKNLHHEYLDKPEHSLKGITCDFRSLDTPANYQTFFNNDKKQRWVIRFKTGKELCGDAEYKVNGSLRNCKTVYRYYDYFPAEEKKGDNDGQDPEVTEDPAVSGQTASNAPTNGMGTYMIGDVIKDEQGNRWFCIAGSPYYAGMTVTDRNATFITFEFNGIDTSGNTIQGLPTEEEIVPLSYLINTIVGVVTSANGYYKFMPGQKYELGKFFQHVSDYANVNMNSAMATVDTTFVFNSEGKTWNSTSQPILFNIAYNDGNTQKQALARVIYDLTQAGIDRTKCQSSTGKKYEDMLFRTYLHYQTYDPSRIRQLDADEQEVGFTRYQLPWPMHSDKIYLQDMADQTMVTRHAADDKWVTLPLYDGVNAGSTNRRSAMTNAVASVRPADFIGNFGLTGTPKTNILGEPVWFIRVCKIEDKGGVTPNTVSTDGRRFTIVHLQNDPMAYNGMMQAGWALNYSSTCSKLFYLDNQLYALPAVPGLEFMAE